MTPPPSTLIRAVQLSMATTLKAPSLTQSQGENILGCSFIVLRLFIPLKHINRHHYPRLMLGCVRTEAAAAVDTTDGFNAFSHLHPILSLHWFSFIYFGSHVCPPFLVSPPPPLHLWMLNSSHTPPLAGATPPIGHSSRCVLPLSLTTTSRARRAMATWRPHSRALHALRLLIRGTARTGTPPRMLPAHR